MYLSAVPFLLKSKIMCICKHSMRWQNEVFIHNTRHEENRIQNNLLRCTIRLNNYFIIYKGGKVLIIISKMIPLRLKKNQTS